MTIFKKLFLVTIALLLISTLFISCSDTEADTSSSESYLVDLTAMEYAFAMPSEIKSGWVTFRFDNSGKETHVAQILHLKGDISFSAFDSIRAKDEYPAIDKVMGGPGLHTGGKSSETTVFLQPGRYVMICGVSNEEGVQHFDLGMMKYLTVTEDVGAESPPLADMNITLDNYKIDMEGELSTGSQTIEVDGHNADFDGHLIVLNDSSTLEAAFDYFSDLRDPNKAIILGGVEEGHTSYYTVDIEPGDYAWSSHEYGQYGMYQKFSITDEGNQILKVGVISDPVDIIDVSIDENSLDIPGEMTPGRKQMQFHADDAGTHDLRFARLKEGKNLDDYMEWFKGTISGEYNTSTRPRVQHYLDVDVLEKGDTGTLSAELFPGRYILYCNTRTEDGSFHLMDGEIKEITVK